MDNKKQTITGLSLKGEAILVYLINLLGFVFSFIKDEVNKEARWIYNQSGAIWITNIGLTIVRLIFAFVPVIGSIISLLCSVAVITLFVFTIIAIVRACDGVHYEIPLVSDLAKLIWKYEDNVVEVKFEDAKEEIKKEPIKKETTKKASSKATKKTETKKTTKTTNTKEEK